MSLIKTFTLTMLALLALTGCANVLPPQPDDPYYAPAIPMNQLQKTARADGSIFSTMNASYLYSDRKASQVGDLITIQLNENTNASKLADTEIKKDNAGDLGSPTIMGRVPSYNGNPLGFSFDASRQFKAEADSEQRNSLNGTITVTVAQVLPNGNLLVKGEKWLTLNQGNEFIRISGIIRPEDISTDNTISSTRVANARISYAGTGQLSESNEMGWLSRFFNTVFFPF